MGHSLFFERIYSFGIDSLFTSRIETNGPKVHLNQLSSTIWNNKTGLTINQNQRCGAVYSHEAFEYPQLSVRTKMPDWKGKNEGIVREYYFGFENGDHAGNMLACFKFERDKNNFNSLHLAVFPNFSYETAVSSKIEKLLPSDWLVTEHNYEIKLYKYLIIFWVDSTIVAIISIVPEFQNFSCEKNNNPAPYIYGNVSLPLPKNMNSLCEVNMLSDNKGSKMTAPLLIQNFRVAAGVDNPILNLNLYKDTNGKTIKKFIDQTIEPLDNIVSVGFPIVGFEVRKIHFLAEKNGTLQVQHLDSNYKWRNLDESVQTKGGVASEISIQSEGVWCKCIWTNRGKLKSKINTAEIFLR